MAGSSRDDKKSPQKRGSTSGKSSTSGSNAASSRGAKLEKAAKAKAPASSPDASKDADTAKARASARGSTTTKSSTASKSSRASKTSASAKASKTSKSSKTSKPSKSKTSSKRSTSSRSTKSPGKGGRKGRGSANGRGPLLTTADGAPVGDQENALSAGPRGPLLMQDVNLIEQIQRFNRERMPERVVHAKGTGAYGTFKVTNDIRRYTRASIFAKKGKKTECVVRFSTVAGERGAADAERDPRGFAMKFYTDEGNWDLVCNNTPVFFVRDPYKFQMFIHSQKRHPETNLRDANMQWDFWSLCPESLHQVTWLFGDRGIPRTYRHMNGYSSHTYSMINDEGERVWVKFHFKTMQGIECLTNAEAAELIAHDRESHQRDMIEAINSGDFPRWKAYIQVMTQDEANEFRWNPFDLTKVWPHGDFPLIEVGELELNRNPKNYHHEVEQSAFNPSAFVPGIGPSPDKMLQARLLSYQDAHLYRVGVNYRDLSVNKPRCPVHNYLRDGQFGGMHDEGTGFPNYYPNSIKGAPRPNPDYNEPPWHLGDVTVDRWDSRVDHDDFTQAGDLFRLMDRDEKVRLAVNIVESMGGCRKDIIKRQLELFEKADPNYGRLVRKALESYRRGDMDDLHESVQPHA